MDSDFGKFLHPEELSPSKYILQTHAYSWENHHCQTTHLQRQWKRLSYKAFNFERFLLAFSHELHRPLLRLLAAKANGLKSWSLDSLCSNILNVPVNQKDVLENDRKKLIEKISENLNSWLKPQQEAIEDAEYKTMEEKASGVGMTNDNVYLYMQGHYVYDLVLRIGKTLCANEHDFKCEVLDPAFLVSGYKEIDLVKSDIAKII